MFPIKKIVNHKSFFNVVVFLSFIHLIMFIDKRAYNCVLIFGSLTIIFNYFLNKIEINLLCSIVATNIFFGCKKNKEGFDIAQITEQLKNIQKNSQKKVATEEEDEEDEEDEEVEEDEEDEEVKKGNSKEMVKKKEEVVKILEKITKKNTKKKEKGNKEEIVTKQKKNIEGLLSKFNELKNNKDAVINPQALSLFMNMNKSISNASDESQFHNLKNLLKNNKEAVKNLIDAF